MSPQDSVVRPGGLVLVTGVNGFIASHVAIRLLKLGYRVRGTVRSAEKASWVAEAVAESHLEQNFETVLVPDVTRLGAWDEAIQGVDGIAHVATDMSFDADPNKVITPMLNGVRNLLEAASKQSTIKRFVFTSSDRAMSNVVNGQQVTLDAGMWNESAVEAAWKPPPFGSDRIWDVYAALKTQSEQEVWKYGESHNPGFTINSVLPTFNIGPIIHSKQAGSTGKWVKDFWLDPAHYKPLQRFGASWFIAVEDTALLHVAAFTEEDVRNERLLGFAGSFNFNSWLSAFRRLDPEKAWPDDDPAQEVNLCTVNTNREQELLKRFGQDGWTSFQESVRRNCFESKGF